jgi:hypothetical protein
MRVLNTYPSYLFPKILAIKIILSLLKNEKRCITSDSVRAISGVLPPIQIIDKKNIPDEGPGLVTLNHYSRNGFSIVWATLGISAQLPKKHLWLMTNAWTNRTRGFDQLRTGVTRILFKRLAGMYGFITTPPMPPALDELAERALSIRKLMRFIHENPQTILCIAPEGQDFEYGKFGKPPEGTGKFILQIQKQLEQIIPVGVWEENGRLILKFGEAYTLDKDCKYEDSDMEISNLVMDKIANLLPVYFLANDN